MSLLFAEYTCLLPISSSHISLVQNELLQFNPRINLESENLMPVDVQNQYLLAYFALYKVAMPF